MATEFDPYYRWLGIPPEDQPPNCYRLLGVRLFEADVNVIESAADQRMAHLHSFQSGEQGLLSQRLLNEVAAARVCLLSPERRAKYDQQLRASGQAMPVDQAIPVAVVIRGDPQGLPNPGEQAGSSFPRGPSGVGRRLRSKSSTIMMGWAIAVLLAAGAVAVSYLGRGEFPADDFRAAAETVAPSDANAPSPPVQRQEVAAQGDAEEPDALPAAQDSQSSAEAERDGDSQSVEANAVPEAVSEESEQPVETRRVDDWHDTAKKDSAIDQSGGADSITARSESQVNAGFDTLVGEGLHGGLQPRVEPSDRDSRPKRLPIPSRADQSKALPLVVDVFRLDPTELADAEPARLSALARSILKTARDGGNDPTAQYVMFRKVCELGSKGGDLPAALEAIDEIAQRFEADATAMRILVTRVALKASVPLASRPKVVDVALPVVDEAIDADLYDEAEGIAVALVRFARGTNRNCIQQISLRRKTIAAQRRVYSKVAAAKRILAENADDPEANTTLGIYLCMKKDQWDEGLARLAVGSDAKLKQAALQERKKPTAPESQLALGDAWFDVVEQLPDDMKVACLDRARSWYDRCLPQLLGLRKLKAEKQLEAIASMAKKLPQAKSAAPQFPCNGVLVAACDYRCEIAINGTIVASTSDSSPMQLARVFTAEDTIIVRARRTSTRRAFACAIRFEGYPTTIVTGPQNSGWMSFRPNSTYQWYSAGGTVVGPALAAAGTSSQLISNLAGTQCGAIWSSQEDMPTSSYSYAYLILRMPAAQRTGNVVPAQMTTGHAIPGVPRGIPVQSPH